MCSVPVCRRAPGNQSERGNKGGDQSLLGKAAQEGDQKAAFKTSIKEEHTCDLHGTLTPHQCGVHKMFGLESAPAAAQTNGDGVTGGCLRNIPLTLFTCRLERQRKPVSL